MLSNRHLFLNVFFYSIEVFLPTTNWNMFLESGLFVVFHHLTFMWLWQVKYVCVLLFFTRTGIGKFIALDFARRGARVILACRSEPRGTAALNEIKQATGNADVHLRIVDLSSMDSVRAFAKRILEEEKALHILVNNAAVSGDTNVELKMLATAQAKPVFTPAGFLSPSPAADFNICKCKPAPSKSKLDSASHELGLSVKQRVED